MKYRCYIIPLMVIGMLLCGSSLSTLSANVDTKYVGLHKKIEELESVVRLQKATLETNKTVRSIKLTAYNAHGSQTDSDPTITASMKKPKPGMVAVSRDLFYSGWTFGKKVYIEDLGIYTIEDLMSEKHSNAIDVLVTSKKEAKKFGKQNRRAVLISDSTFSDPGIANEACNKAFL